MDDPAFEVAKAAFSKSASLSVELADSLVNVAESSNIDNAGHINHSAIARSGKFQFGPSLSAVTRS